MAAKKQNVTVYTGILLIYNLLKPYSYTKIILASCKKFRYDQVGGMYDRLLLKNIIEKNV